MVFRKVMVLAMAVLMLTDAAGAREKWSDQQANDWYSRLPWLVGCNYTPATAINQLEMWQADSFDPKTIDRELGWAKGLGFTSLRVYLHDIPWKQDSAGFIQRIDQFLAIANKHGIGVVFVLFDSCWDPFPKAGRQRDPRPHVHNSGWVQSPGVEILKDIARHDELEGYVKGIVTHFRGDKRIHAWDLFNEPDNRNDNSYGPQDLPNKAEVALALLKKTFAWARACNPTQPLTTGVWHGDWSKSENLSPMIRYQLEESDVISFHNYGPAEQMNKCVESLKRFGRPILCTEYMARPAGSTFAGSMPILKENRVGAYNWGFVAGKTQTQYPWDSWQKQYTAEPPVWFHEILRPDGSPYIEEEVKLIRRLTGKP